MPDFNALLQANRPHLSQKEQGLGDYLVQHAAAASTMSISALAQVTGVSTATLSRFAKALGLANFQALRVALAQAPAHLPLFEELDASDAPLAVAKKLFALNQTALAATADRLDAATLEQATGLITGAKTLGLFGLGASNLVALDGYHKFLRTPIDVAYTMDYHMQLMAATRLGEQDAALVISHTGIDLDALALAETLQHNQVPLIVITGDARSPLAAKADCLLVAVAEETEYRAEAMHALIAQLSLMDTLFVLAASATDTDSAKVLDAIRGTIAKTRR
ncbi:MurR/RpiR family transcriptional regulator [Lacticaseibacillus parakribbianus]|uniref:MurR/RpiR family transcriptional regulator n=1 Tax=Lacticaseibacillus parakribbianus TaxID=2970927 RepID=UPI0021CB746B|nr:MurR/RpiR family transcriptional regulator [Lacticaseibacillus parakribbianus]